MTRAFLWVILSMLMIAGLAGTMLYGVALITTGNRNQSAQDYGALSAFSVVALLAGVLLLLGLRRRLPVSVRLPDERIILALFAAAVAAGFVSTLFDRFVFAAPLFALVAAVALVLFIMRIAVRWTADRTVSPRELVGPALWGMIGAPLAAGAAQLTTVIMLVAGGVAGMYVADASLIDAFGTWAEEAAESADLSIMRTPSVAFAAVAVLGITAPLTEELTKFLGVYLVFRHRAATRFGLFVAGVAAGLGFAAVETLGYALMAVEQWPQVMLLRAPVALIHVAATTIVALGWYKQRQSGGHWLILFFALSVGIHAAWNSLFVSMMILASGFDTSDQISPAEGLLVLAVAGAMGAVLVGSALWIIGNARRMGRDERPDYNSTVDFAGGVTLPRATAHQSAHLAIRRSS